MFRQGPPPSPGPRWEALREPTNDSSEAEDSENTAASVARNAERTNQPLKRKDNDRSFTLPSVAKRPRHEQDRSESISAPGPSGSSQPSLLASSQAGPSRISNHRPSSSATSISARNVDVSQVAPDVSKPRPKPRPAYKHIQVFNSSERDVSGGSGGKKGEKSSDQRRSFPGSSSVARPSSSASSSKPNLSKGKKPASQAKSTFVQNEVIEISSDSEPSSRPKPKTLYKSSKPSSKVDSSKVVPRARKKTSDGQKSRPNVSKGTQEVIVIDDSDDELALLPSRFSPTVMGSGSSTKVPEKRISAPPASHGAPMQPDSDEVMETDDETHAASGTAPDMDVDQIVQPPPPIATPPPAIAATPVTVPPLTTTTSPIAAVPPPSTTPPLPSIPRINAATPIHAELSPPSTTPIGLSGSRVSESPSSAKKPTFNRQGLNPFPAPSLDDDDPLPSPPKRRLQSGTKTASVRKRIVSSSSSSSEEESSAVSGHDHSATRSKEASSAAEDGMDMRNLSNALDVAVPPNRPHTPDHGVRRDEPISPQPRKAADSPTNVTYKTKQLARKSTGGKTPKVSLTASVPTARKSGGGTGGGIPRTGTTLAEAITSAGIINAASRHHKKDRGSITSLSGLTSDHEEISANNPLPGNAKASGSKTFATASASNKEKRPDVGLSSHAPSAKPSSWHSRAMSSRSGTDELLLRPSEPSPPVTPSPVQTPALSGLQPLSSALSLESVSHTARPRSAPLLADASLTLVAETQARPLTSVLQSPRTLANVPSLARAGVQVRPFSMDSVPRPSTAETVPGSPQSPPRDYFTSARSPVRSSKIPIRQVQQSPTLAPALPISPKSPEFPNSLKPSPTSKGSTVPEREPTLSPSRSPKSPKLPHARVSSLSPHLQQQSSFSEVFEQLVQENASGAGASTQTVEAVVLAAAARSADDADMDASFEGRPSSAPPPPESSDDEAMDEVAEVEALVEDDEVGFEVPEHAWDDVETIETPDMTRRSSRSSTSENWPVSADDDHFASLDVSRQATPEEGLVIVVQRGKSYGGFSAITWPDHVRNAKNLPPIYNLAKDIPHIFEDHVNNMTPYTRMMPEMRKVYEARILENTVEDEPDAPPIEIQNDVDEEATPPWEFFYSNKMWHGEGVPLPDTKSLVRCNCKGVCNPKSKTCACLKRQREACQDLNVEFAYDKTGKLKIPGYPIFECNEFCGCGDECRNRVVQHGRKVSVAIRKTPTKGWGVFATKKILAGSYIGIYAGELITDVIAQERGVKYNKFGRTYLFDIDFHHLRDADDQDWTNQFTVDAYHAGNFTRFLNHSCDPNSRLFACYINEGNLQKPLLAIFSLRDIESNEEICFNYTGNYPGEEDENDEDDNEDSEEPNADPASRDIIYERCMCGTVNCTGTVFK